MTKASRNLAEVPRTVPEAAALYELAAKKLHAAWKSESKVPYKEALAWARALDLVLSCYVLPQNWDSMDAPTRAEQSLPPGIVYILRNQLRYLVAGQLPEPFSFLLRRGRPSVGPHEEKAMAMAVAYVKASRAGLTEDKSSLKTVMQLYSVSERTVWDWLAKYSHLEPTDFFVGKSGRALGTCIETAMKKQGARYAFAGRSASAVIKRNSKAAHSTKRPARK